MATLICPQSNFEEELVDFIDDLQAFTAIFFWPERATWLLDFDGHPSTDTNGSKRTEPLISRALRAAREYVLEARWDEGKGSQDEFLLWMETVEVLPSIPHFGAGTGKDYGCIRLVAETSIARWAVDSGDSLTLRQMSLLSKKAEGSLRNSAYADGPDQLSIENGMVANAEAKRWLMHRTDYEPTTQYNSEFGVAGDIVPIGTLHQVPDLVKWRAKALDVPVVAVLRALGEKPSKKLLKWDKELPDAARALVYRQVRDVGTCIRLATLLRLDPTWFSRRVGELIADQERDAFLNRRESAIAKIQLPKTASNNDSTRVVFLDAHPTSSERVRLYLEQHPEIEHHPSHSPSNAKMYGYLTRSGLAIAVEHNLKHPALWIRAVDVPQQLTDMRCTFYDADSIGKNGRYGRHSGLKKFAELATTDLQKFVPRRMGELVQLIDFLISRPESEEASK